MHASLETGPAPQVILGGLLFLSVVVVVVVVGVGLACVRPVRVGVVGVRVGMAVVMAMVVHDLMLCDHKQLAHGTLGHNNPNDRRAYLDIIPFRLVPRMY